MTLLFKSFPFTSTCSPYQVELSRGKYLFELWGAQGGGVDGGKGGYTSGIISIFYPTTFYVLVTGIIGGLQSYADSQILAQGVSGGRTIVYYIWTYGIGDNADYGLASAASVFLALIIIALSIIQFSRNKMFKKVR